MTGFSDPQRNSASTLIREIEELRDLMIDVATGVSRIEQARDGYLTRRESIRVRLAEFALEDPNQFTGLWDWYHRWSSGDLPSYRSRRAFLREIYAPTLGQLEAIERGVSPAELREPTGWPKVDQVVSKMRLLLARAVEPEDFQQVGLLAREILISLAQAVYDAGRHVPEGGIAASSTDAARMLEAYISTEMAGGENAEIRRHAKASLQLAVALQHKRTADFRIAALACEASSSVVNIIAIMSGRRDSSRVGSGDA